MGITGRAGWEAHSQQKATQEASSPSFSIMHPCCLPAHLLPGLLPSLTSMTFPISPVCETFKIPILYYFLKSISSFPVPSHLMLIAVVWSLGSFKFWPVPLFIFFSMNAILKGCFPFTVTSEHCVYSRCCALPPGAHLTPLTPRHPWVTISLFSVSSFLFFSLVCCIF